MPRNFNLGSTRDLQNKTIYNIRRTVWGENNMKLALALFFSSLVVLGAHYYVTLDQNYLTTRFPFESALLFAAVLSGVGVLFLLAGLYRYLRYKHSLREAEEIGLRITEVNPKLYKHFRRSLGFNRTKTICKFFNLNVGISSLIVTVIAFALISFGFVYALNFLSYGILNNTQKTVLKDISSTLKTDMKISTDRHFGVLSNKKTSMRLLFNNDGKIYATNQNVGNKNMYLSAVEYQTTEKNPYTAISALHRNNRKYSDYFGTPDVLKMNIKISDKMKDYYKRKDSLVECYSRVINKNRVEQRVECVGGLLIVSIYENNYDFDYESYKEKKKVAREKKRKQEEKEMEKEEKIEQGDFVYDGKHYDFRVRRKANGYEYWYYTNHPETIED